jgi:hypothetical protein
MISSCRFSGADLEHRKAYSASLITHSESRACFSWYTLTMSTTANSSSEYVLELLSEHGKRRAELGRGEDLKQALRAYEKARCNTRIRMCACAKASRPLHSACLSFSQWQRGTPRIE